MRLFQNSALYDAYLHRLNGLTPRGSTFAERRGTFLNDRFGACHFLKPVLEGDELAFFTNGDDEVLQRQWAAEHGLPSSTPFEQILLAQIEDHRTEVFYNLDPMRFSSDFVRRLPGCVRKSVAWRAAPSPRADFSAYDMIVCNFPSIIAGYRQHGWRADYFSPAHDPEMDEYAPTEDRPIDVLFVGGYSRHHRRRAAVLEAVAALMDEFRVVFCVDRSRLTRLAESNLGRLLPMGEHRRPPNVRAVSKGPVFGRDLYAMISRAKIVLNGAVDMAGLDRGNMRCFEALGCGALLVSDWGNYPPGLEDGETMMLYSNPEDAPAVIQEALANPERSRSIAAHGYQAVRTLYNKDRQWDDFVRLVETL